MTSEQARLVAPSGATFSAPFHNLTARSVFVAGRVPLGFDEQVKAVLLGHAVDARVAFAPADPPGVVLTFEAGPELEAAIRAFRGSAEEDWNDLDVTGTHDAEEAVLMEQHLARIAPESSADVDSEDPTNPGARSLEFPEEEVTPPSVPAVYADGRVLPPDEETVQEGLQQSLAAGQAKKGTRLRATTQVSAIDEEE